MAIGAAEALVLAALAALLYGALAPLRRRLEVWFARRLPRAKAHRRVVVLGRRRDGTFGRGDRHDG